MKSDYRREFAAAVRLSRLPGVGAARFADLIKQHGLPSTALAEVNGNEDLFANDKAPMENEQNQIAAYLENGGFGVYLGAEDYPRLLRQTPEPPPYLFRRGPLWPLDTFAVAIVGPRKSSQKGKRFAAKLARGLAELGVTIISGGALGVDAAAHNAAMATSGRTVLVTATGIDRFYPPQNEQLFRQVAHCGCILTELMPGTPPRRDFFPTRNRIITGLAQALVVVEGSRKSGTASSYAQMRKLNRPIFTWTGGNHGRFDLAEDILDHGGKILHEPDAELIVQTVLRQQNG